MISQLLKYLLQAAKVQLTRFTLQLESVRNTLVQLISGYLSVWSNMTTCNCLPNSEVTF